MILNKIKKLNYLSNYFLEFAFTLTAFISLMATKSVSPLIYNLANLISVFMLFFIRYALSIERYRIKIKNIAVIFFIFDFISLIIVQYFSLESLVIRFFLTATLFPLVICIREAIVFDTQNKLMSGNELTNFSLKNQAFFALGGFCGSGIAILFNLNNYELNLEFSLALQLISVAFELYVARLWLKL